MEANTTCTAHAGRKTTPNRSKKDQAQGLLLAFASEAGGQASSTLSAPKGMRRQVGVSWISSLSLVGPTAHPWMKDVPPVCVCALDRGPQFIASP